MNYYKLYLEEKAQDEILFAAFEAETAAFEEEVVRMETVFELTEALDACADPTYRTELIKELRKWSMV